MNQLTRRARLLLLPVAMLLIAMHGTATAATWESPTTLAGNGSIGPGSLVTLGPSRAVAVYGTIGGRVFARTSVDGGDTWQPAIRLSRVIANIADSAAVAGRGNIVDATWIEYEEDACGVCQVMYSRSVDGGETFGSAIALTPKVFTGTDNSRVARGRGDVVAVVWEDYHLERSRIRVSTDGGATFGPPTSIGPLYAYDPVVAIGNGVIHVAYRRLNDSIYVRRSLDDGTSWSRPTRVADRAFHDSEMDISAYGNQAALVFTARHKGGVNTPALVRTSDRGASWSRPLNLSSPSGLRSGHPVVALRHGLAQVAFTRCNTAACRTRGVFYRQSVDGVTWTPAERVAGVGGPAGVGFTSRILVMYHGLRGIQVRAATR
jgi:photosystem II stability/assembly factor-like uncharacterized protein